MSNINISSNSDDYFPSSPKDGDVFTTQLGNIYKLKGDYWILQEHLSVLGESNSQSVSLVQSEVEALRNLLNLFQLNGNKDLLSIYRKINNL